MDLGFEKSGFEIELVNEFSPSFIRAYRYARETMNLRKPKYGYQNIDVNEYLSSRKEELRAAIEDARADGSLVGFIGGPPCPDFSVAGKQRGRDGDNGKLSLSYVQLIVEQKPDYFLFENVKGLWRTAKHRAYYEELKQLLRDAGYDTTERLTNALEFGAPQDRDRILLFGVQKDILRKKGLNLDNFKWDKFMCYDLEKVKALDWPKAEPFERDSVRGCPENIPKELTAEYWFEQNDVEHHPNANDSFTPRGGLAKMRVIEEGDDSKKSYKRIHRWRYSPTVCYGNNEVHLHPYKERRLSAAEALALQSLPKEFTLPPDMSLTDKFKTIGNGVPYLLASGVAHTIYDFLNGETCHDVENHSLQSGTSHLQPASEPKL